MAWDEALDRFAVCCIMDGRRLAGALAGNGVLGLLRFVCILVQYHCWLYLRRLFVS